MPDGVEFNDGPWRKLLAQAYELDKAHVKVGVLSSRGGDEPHDAKGDMTLVEIAAVHEFGSPAAGVPERSFIRRTFANAAWLPSFTARLAKAVVTGGMPVERALAILGQRSVQEVKATITGDPPIPPPLEPATIARKGSDRPLVDTGRLLGAIQFEVVLDDGGDAEPMPAAGGGGSMATGDGGGE